MYTKDRHRRIDAGWDAEAAHQYICQLFDEAEGTCSDKGYFPPHPEDGNVDELGFHSALYHGFSGLAWAQIELASLGYGEISNHYEDTIERCRLVTVEALRKDCPFSNREDYLHGLLIAELGYWVPLVRSNASEARTSAVLDLVRQNLHNRVLEFLWGSPGSMLYLSALIENGTIDAGSADLLREGVAFLKEELIESPSRQCLLWEQHLYGEHVNLLGAGHGFASNALAVLRSFPYLPEEEQGFWRSLIRDTTIRTADRDGELANWAQSVDEHRDGRTDWLVQWCHGAPGMVISLASLMGEEPDFDQVLLAGGELTWVAGPLAKGSGFCHGTAGNGWAFLKLFDATGDEKWLDRAKNFAAAAIMQSLDERGRTGEFRYSLWTGDHSVALFADACLNQRFQVPTIERF